MDPYELEAILRQRRRKQSPEEFRGGALGVQTPEAPGEIIIPPTPGPVGPPAIDAEPPPVPPSPAEGRARAYGWNMSPRVTDYLREKQAYRFDPNAAGPTDRMTAPPPDLDQPLAYGGSRGAEAAPAPEPAAPLLGSKENLPLPADEDFKPEEHTPEAEDKLRTKRMNDIAAYEKAREGRTADLEKWRGVAQGLGKLGQGLAGLRGHLPPEAFPAQDTSAIDREIERSEDLLSPQEEEMLRAAFGDRAIPSGMRRSTLRTTLPAMAAFIARQEQTKATASNRDKRDEDLLYAEESKERGRIVTRVRELKKGKIAAENALGLIDNGSPQAIGSAMFALSKASGNVGAPSDRDIAIIEGNYGVPGLMNKIERGFTGNFTDDQKKALRDIANLARDNANRHLQEEESAGLDSFWAANQERASRFGRSPEKYKQMFGPLYGAGGGAAGGKVTMVLPDGTEVPDIDPSQVPRFQQKYQGAKVK